MQISDAAAEGKPLPSMPEHKLASLPRIPSLIPLLHQLPASLEWAVVFRTGALLKLISAQQLERMLGLPIHSNLSKSVSAALTSAGKCLAFDEAGPWIWSGRSSIDADQTAAERFGDRLSLLSTAKDADCIGFGKLPGRSPVLMVLTIDMGVAKAEALFEQRPSEDHYDLLSAVGVRFLGGEWRSTYWCARFTNDLGDHFRAATSAHFSRTAHCNLFFLGGGYIDAHLEAGLLHAATSRIQQGLSIAVTTAVNLILTARKTGLAMTCIPPTPESPYSFGDLVPLGILTYALRGLPGQPEAVEAALILAERYLDQHRVGDLWPFHRGRLPTALDTALILLAQNDARGVGALERFRDNSGGYLPQLSEAEDDQLNMPQDTSIEHWRQTDFATTCLVRGLRRSADLEERTPISWLEAWFEHRAGLFFANPYLVDWALANAIAEDEQATGLRVRLTAELLASANDDGSFGRFDEPLSTALAIATLALLGHRSRVILLAQLRLLEMLGFQGRGPATTPFYSSRRVAPAARAGEMSGNGVLFSGEQWHWLSLYEDTHRMVLDGFVVMALRAPSDAREPAPARTSPAQPRYLSGSAARYVEEFALPPYLRSSR